MPGPALLGVVLLLGSGHRRTLVRGLVLARMSLTFNGHQITFLMMIYGFVASVLPVWFLLEPRDYLSTYMKLGTIVLLIIGVFIVHPNIQFPP